jgi:hypothetical protein
VSRRRNEVFVSGCGDEDEDEAKIILLETKLEKDKLSLPPGSCTVWSQINTGGNAGATTTSTEEVSATSKTPSLDHLNHPGATDQATR